MKLSTCTPAVLFVSMLAAFAPAMARQAPDPAARIAAQQQAMQPLASIDGVWRGTTTEYGPDGTKLERGYTEHITSMLDGTLKMLDGRKEDVEGADRFHVVGILSCDPVTGKYTMRAYWPSGEIGDAPFTVTANGFGWRVELSDDKSIVATGTVEGGVWRERIELVASGEPPRLLEERVLRRVGD